MNDPRDDLINVLSKARNLLARPDNDYAWSSWRSPEEALVEVDDLIVGVRQGGLRKQALEVIFSATGPMQDVSYPSGWGQEFLDLAVQFDAAMERLLESPAELGAKGTESDLPHGRWQRWLRRLTGR